MGAYVYICVCVCVYVDDAERRDGHLPEMAMALVHFYSALRVFFLALGVGRRDSE